MKKNSRQLFHLNLTDWTWWAWTVTAVLLIAGLFGFNPAFPAALAVTAGQGIMLLVRDRSPAAFSVQIRVAYLLLMLISYPSPMRWFYWLLMVGTVALIVFGYCTMARLLSLAPWNSRDTYTVDRLRRTFFSAPDLDRASMNSEVAGCAGGLCTIEAQIAPPATDALVTRTKLPAHARSAPAIQVTCQVK